MRTHEDLDLFLDDLKSLCDKYSFLIGVEGFTVYFREEQIKLVDWVQNGTYFYPVIENMNGDENG